MPRFFIADNPAAGSEYRIYNEDARHISRSLRMRAGEELVLCTHSGVDCLCEIAGIHENEVHLRVLKCKPNESETRAPVSVYQCLPKSDKLELIIQKSTELGAVRVVPVESCRCISKPDKWEKKLVRLEKIALEAAKQSGRGRVPEVLSPMKLEAALRQAAAQGEVIFFYEAAGEPLKQILMRIPPDAPIAVFVGPEGGFSPEEAGLAAALGAGIATLGRRILRTETAAPAALAMILYERGEMQ